MRGAFLAVALSVTAVAGAPFVGGGGSGSGGGSFNGDLNGTALTDSSDDIVEIDDSLKVIQSGTTLGRFEVNRSTSTIFSRWNHVFSNNIDAQGSAGIVNSSAANGGDVMINDGLRVTGSISDPNDAIVNVDDVLTSNKVAGTLYFNNNTEATATINANWTTFGQGIAHGCSNVTCTGNTGVIAPQIAGDYLVHYSSSYRKVGGLTAVELECSIFLNETEQPQCSSRQTLEANDYVAGDKTCQLLGVAVGNSVTVRCRRLSGTDFTIGVVRTNTTVVLN